MVSILHFLRSVLVAGVVGIPVVFVAVGLGTLHEEYGVKDDSLNNNDYYK